MLPPIGSFSLPIVGETLVSLLDPGPVLAQNAVFLSGREGLSAFYDPLNVKRHGAEVGKFRKLVLNDQEAVPKMDGPAHCTRKAFLLAAHTPEWIDGYLNESADFQDKLVGLIKEAAADAGAGGRVALFPIIQKTYIKMLAKVWMGLEAGDEYITNVMAVSAGMQAKDALFATYADQLAEHRENSATFPHSALSALLAKQQHYELSDLMILTELHHFVSASSGLMAPVISAAIMDLASNPEALTRALAKADTHASLLPSVRMADIGSQLPFLAWMIKEAPRKYPPAPTADSNTREPEVAFTETAPYRLVPNMAAPPSSPSLEDLRDFSDDPFSLVPLTPGDPDDDDAFLLEGLLTEQTLDHAAAAAAACDARDQHDQDDDSNNMLEGFDDDSHIDIDADELSSNPPTRDAPSLSHDAEVSARATASPTPPLVPRPGQLPPTPHGAAPSPPTDVSLPIASADRSALPASPPSAGKPPQYSLNPILEEPSRDRDRDRFQFDVLQEDFDDSFARTDERPVSTNDVPVEDGDSPRALFADHGLKEIEQMMDELKKENFNLRLRIYHMTNDPSERPDGVTCIHEEALARERLETDQLFDEYRTAHTEMRARTEQLESEAADAAHELAELTAALAAAQRETESQSELLESANRELERIPTLDALCHRLREDRDSARKAFKDMQAATERLRAERTKAEEDAARARAESRATAEKLTAVEAVMERAKADFETERGAWREEVERVVESRVAEATKKRDVRIQRLNEEVDHLNKQLIESRPSTF
ncbi:cytochrome P450 [Blyttiomyces helicus]|uniref:Cytochrome P450 n=1 Tax=Blyttiomyces helicus TaxID=388810 RepID=A0A4P9WCC4_9FUNG|nr:cytochrome P450 [Blyttiomyces helicus]|eukprot:RKO88858.1 cytochrome P450 [Blyttiomyces helicus]